MKISLALVMILLASQLTAQTPVEDLTTFVNPMIGTHKMGHTYPGDGGR